MSERVELDEHKKHDDGLDDVFVIGDDEETLYEESATPADPHRSTFCATKSISEEYFKGENRQTVPSDADSLPKWQAGEESAHHSSALEPDDFEPGWDTERPPTGNPYGAPWAIKGDAAESKEAQGKVPFGCRPPSSIYGAPPPTPKVGRSLLRS
ncbi:MAG: hypothetical protein M1820_009000 [Bogoriella megaspora]|nr:MAG: hypothetical protein M1820_009000 [Bogoriella megaspora]